ncbi:hypothetical protein GCM10011490_10660 [Pseudoclavibacter endophyticus]|nr:hypothetical protein GCM10011490_10660 [Pseudoclavibacter endophyticus]
MKKPAVAVACPTVPSSHHEKEVSAGMTFEGTKVRRQMRERDDSTKRSSAALPRRRQRTSVDSSPGSAWLLEP